MEVVLKDKTCVISSRSGATLEASRPNQSMRVVNAVSEAISGAALMTSEAPHIETWHYRLGHLNTQSLYNVMADMKLPWFGVIK